MSECVPDSVNKRIWITSAYIQKGNSGQLLNIEEESSPQPTPEASFDSTATTSIVADTNKTVNTAKETLDVLNHSFGQQSSAEQVDD